MHLPSRSLQVQKGHPQQNHGRNVWDKKCPSTIFVDEVGKTPEGSEADCESN